MLLACAPTASRAESALQRWSFEPPGFGRSTLQVSDHAYLQHDGLWHFFYTHRWTPEEPYQAIGHAVSPDLRHWSERPSVVVAETAAPAWRREAVWAPHVVAWPGGGWVMAMTGVDSDLSQRIGFLWSDELEHWTEDPAILQFTPDPFLYTYIAGMDNDCRDPHLHFEDGQWHLLFTARGADGRAVVGRAVSPDLASWSHRPPLVSVGDPWQLPDAESPGLLIEGGTYLLVYSRTGVQALQAPALEGPWDPGQAVRLDPFGFASELVRTGSRLLLSRSRFSTCDFGVTVVWCDTLELASGTPTLLPTDALAEFPLRSGDAFLDQPTYGDTPAARGEGPTAFEGLCWLSSREWNPEPRPERPCGLDRGPGPRGEIRSLPFVLQGDTVTVRLGGAVSPDSVYVALHDDCTGERLVRFAPQGSALELQSAPAASWLGRRMAWRIVDDLSRPGGWIGLDDLEVRASPGLPPAAPAPLVSWEFPLGGERFSGGERVRLRWSVDHPGTVDSLVLFSTYDGGETLRRLAGYDGNRKQDWWTVPDTLLFDARVRLVAYPSGGPIGCGSSGAFHVNAIVDAGPGSAPGSLTARHGSGGPWLEGVLPAGVVGEARLEVYDLRGRRVAVPWRGRGGERFRVLAPRHDRAGRRLPAGLYFARLAIGDRRWETRYLGLGSGAR